MVARNGESGEIHPKSRTHDRRESTPCRLRLLGMEVAKESLLVRGRAAVGGWGRQTGRAGEHSAQAVREGGSGTERLAAGQEGLGTEEPNARF